MEVIFDRAEHIIVCEAICLASTKEWVPGQCGQTQVRRCHEDGSMGEALDVKI